MAEDNTWQVKLIMVKPGGKLSLQMHHHRSEHWVVVNGTARVEVDNKVEVLSENQSVYIPLGSKHRLSNPGENISNTHRSSKWLFLGAQSHVAVSFDSPEYTANLVMHLVH